MVVRLLCLLLLFSPLAVVAGHEEKLELRREELQVTLPKAISDHSAVLASDNLIYIAGGCDSPDGNIFDANSSFFFCPSVSDSFFAFDPSTGTFETLPILLRPRYRHAAVAIQNHIFLVGGRDVEDNLIAEVDVFDIANQNWATTVLPEPYVTSDLAGWATDTHGFFVGGYNADYVAQDRVWSIEVATYSETGELGIADHSPLLDARGDVSASVNLETGYAYVSGGFTHENDFCEPLDSVERYSISGDTWLEVARLPTARADKVMVTFEGRTISMGGERQIEEKCELEKITPGELSMAVDDIEVLNDDDSSWQQLEPLPEHRFRFAAVVFEDTIYTFGGQEAYDETCNCLKTTNEVVAYEVVNPEHTHDQGGEGEHLPLGSEDVATADSSNEASQAVALKSILVPSLFIMAVSAYFLC